MSKTRHTRRNRYEDDYVDFERDYNQSVNARRMDRSDRDNRRSRSGRINELDKDED